MNKTVICWIQHRSLVGGELLIEKSLEISHFLEIGGQPLSFYFSDEGLVNWDGKLERWGDLKKSLRQNPSFSLDDFATIPVEVRPCGEMWRCDLREVQLAAEAIGDKNHRRNLQIEDLREKLKELRSITI